MIADSKNPNPPPPYDASQAEAASSSQPAVASGPTPITSYFPVGVVSPDGQTVAFLPYHDPRSPYAIDQAIVRARRRFFGALLWALAIYIVMGGFVGGGIAVDSRRVRMGRLSSRHGASLRMQNRYEVNQPNIPFNGYLN